MAEPSSNQLKQIVEIFLQEYNEQNKSSYFWDDKKSYNAKSQFKRWADAIIFNENGHELEIQHKEVVWDALYDKIRSNASKKVVDALIETLSNHGLHEYSIHLNFYQKHIPRDAESIREFCFWVTELASMKTSDAYPRNYHLFLIPNTISGLWLKLRTLINLFIRGVRESFYLAIDKDEKVRQLVYKYDKDDNEYLEKIMKVTSYITIFRIPKQTKPIIGWGYSELAPRPLPHYGDVVVSEIERNVVNKYSSQIILLDCARPIDNYDMELIETQIQEMTINNQVWLVENFASKRAATRLA